MIERKEIHEVIPYINWIYFFHAWGFEPCYAAIAQIHNCESCRKTWITTFKQEDERQKATEALQLFCDAQKMLQQLDKEIQVQTTYRLFQANSDGNDLLLGNIRLPLLRQQKPSSPNGTCLCLSDFVRPLSSGKPDIVGAFAASVSDDLEKQYINDSYQLLLLQTLSDRLVEAGVELMHLNVRTDTWGYSPNEQLTINELLAEHFQGIRPAVGYPSLPDQSINFILDKLLDFNSIGIKLTENGAMSPHASISGLMLAHPEAHYFNVGSIGEDQLKSYASRRGLSLEEIKRFIK